MTARDDLIAEFLARPGVEVSRSFGHDALGVRGRLFCLLRDEAVVLKLPAARIDALEATDAGARFRLGGRVMREWVVVPGHDPRLTAEALAFVSALPPRSARSSR